MNKNDISVQMDEFIFEVPINMPLVHEKALVMALSENSLAYLEFTTNNLWSLYSGVNVNRLPPFRHTKVNTDGDFITWDKTIVESNFKTILENNIGHVKVIGTDFNSLGGVYNSFEFNLLDQNYPNIKIQHSYRTEWGLHNFDVKPSPIQPSMFEQMNIPLVPSFYVFKYKFKYDAEYPVLVEVTDKKSAKIYPDTGLFEENQGYTMQFLDYVVIYGNQPRTFVSNSYASGGVNDPLNTIDTSAIADLGVEILPESYFCDEEQSLSGNITLQTYDSRLNSVLGNVNVFYECGSYKNNCFIGKTDSQGKLTSTFPLCQNGEIRLSKEDYATKRETLTIESGDSFDIDYYISPYYDLDIEVKKYQMGQPNTIGILNSLSSGERVTMTVKKQGSSDFDTIGTQTLIFSSDLDTNEITLTPGSYEMSGILLVNGFTIPANCKKYCIAWDSGLLGIGGGNCKTYDYLPTDPVVFEDSAPLGGIEVGSSNSYWEITENDLSNSQKITLYVIELPQPTCIDEANGPDEECLVASGCISMDEMSKTEEYSTMFRTELEPRFI
jgi:hypothetical protein